jgi:hypothetical protein
VVRFQRMMFQMCARPMEFQNLHYVKLYAITDFLFPYTPRFIEMLLADIAKKAGVQKK